MSTWDTRAHGLNVSQSVDRRQWTMDNSKSMGEILSTGNPALDFGNKSGLETVKLWLEPIHSRQVETG